VSVLFGAASFRDRSKGRWALAFVAPDPRRLQSVQQAKGGRLALMFERHSGAIGRTLRRQGLSAEAVEDATQQAFLIASERLDQIRPDRERAFLFGVGLRVTSSKRRRLARYQFEADMDVHAAPGSAQDEANQRVLALELFNQVLERLDRDLAQAFVLFELEQLSKNEVARELGIPPGTAASRRRRARQTVEATMARLSQRELSGARSSAGQKLNPPRSASASKARGTLAKIPVAVPSPGAPSPGAWVRVAAASGAASTGGIPPGARAPVTGEAVAPEGIAKVPIAKMPGGDPSGEPQLESRRRIA